MSKKINLKGRRFDRLLVMTEAGRSRNGAVLQVTKWDCGAWRCPGCEATFIPDDAAILLDAVLRHDGHLDETAIDNWITRAWDGRKP